MPDHSWVDRGTVRVKCLVQEHNTGTRLRVSYKVLLWKDCKYSENKLYTKGVFIFTCFVFNGVTCLGIPRVTDGVDCVTGVGLGRLAAVGGLAVDLIFSACFPGVSRRFIPVNI